MDIPETREDAQRDDDIRELMQETRLYSDGSLHDKKVGAAACLIRPDGTTRTLRLHLGSAQHYTVHSAESVGLLMATHLLSTEPVRPLNEISFGVDNQAVLKGLTRHRHAPGQWATDLFRDKIAEYAAHGGLRLTARWTPGHIGIAGNELVDVAAKEAAEGAQHTSPLADLPLELQGRIPHSIAAIRQAFNKRTSERAAKRWKWSKRHNLITKIDDTLPSDRYLKLVAGRTRAQSTAIFWLRSGYAPLNAYLDSIHAREDGPACEACAGDGIAEAETVRHFLLDCPAHDRPRRRLRAALGVRKAGDIRYLLGDRRAFNALIRYIDKTGRFAETLGTLVVPPPRIPEGARVLGGTA